MTTLPVHRTFHPIHKDRMGRPLHTAQTTGNSNVHHRFRRIQEHQMETALHRRSPRPSRPGRKHTIASISLVNITINLTPQPNIHRHRFVYLLFIPYLSHSMLTPSLPATTTIPPKLSIPSKPPIRPTAPICPTAPTVPIRSTAPTASIQQSTPTISTSTLKRPISYRFRF